MISWQEVAAFASLVAMIGMAKTAYLRMYVGRVVDKHSQRLERLSRKRFVTKASARRRFETLESRVSHLEEDTHHEA